MEEGLWLSRERVLGLGSSLAREVVVLEEVDSTQRVARELAEGGAPEGTIVLARVQLGGKGRLGREWGSPPGGLWMSLVLRPEFEARFAPRITQISAVAVARALIGLGVPAKVKWPNDVLVGGRKVCGILAESSLRPTPAGTLLEYVLLGVGLNVNVEPEDLVVFGDRATTVRESLGREVDLLDPLARILRELETGLPDVRSFSRTRKDLRSLSHTLGRQVRVARSGGAVEGLAVDITAEGALVLQTEGGMVELFEGDVENLRDRPEG